MDIPHKIEGVVTDKPTLIFLNGLRSHSDDWNVQNTININIQKSFVDKTQTMCFDFPADICRQSIDNIIRQILSIIGKNSDRFVIIGKSYGGFIGMLIAQQYPRLVTGLVLIDSSTAMSVDMIDNLIKFEIDDEKKTLYQKIRGDLLDNHDILLDNRINLICLINLPTRKYLEKSAKSGSSIKYIQHIDSLLSFYDNISSNPCKKIIVVPNGFHDFTNRHQMIKDCIESIF
jgi:pimeloyl-ACP methyl ester carboxylesterase